MATTVGPTWKGSFRIDGSIVTEGRDATPIPNAQKFQLSPSELGVAMNFGAVYPDPPYKVRSPANPIYNCHGLTFASRRTWIYGGQEVRMILGADGYSPVSPVDLLPGDIVLYVSESGDPEHSGVVVDTGLNPKPIQSIAPIGMPTFIGSTTAPLLLGPTVCSKFGGGPEVLHPLLKAGPYSSHRIEYWRVDK